MQQAMQIDNIREHTGILDSVTHASKIPARPQNFITSLEFRIMILPLPNTHTHYQTEPEPAQHAPDREDTTNKCVFSPLPFQLPLQLSRASPSQDLAHAAVRDPKLTTDVARTNPVVRELHDLPPDGLGERAAVYEHSAKLVDAALSVRTFPHLVHRREVLSCARGER